MVSMRIPGHGDRDSGMMAIRIPGLPIMAAKPGRSLAIRGTAC